MDYNRYFVQTIDRAMERVEGCEKDIATALFLETEHESMDTVCFRIFTQWFGDQKVTMVRVLQTQTWIQQYLIEQASRLYAQVHPDATIVHAMGQEITLQMMAHLHPYYVEGAYDGNA